MRDDQRSTSDFSEEGDDLLADVYRDMQAGADGEYHFADDVICDRCHYPEGSFACKIRHLGIQTGAARAAND